jgi:hypothetical protein
MADCKFCLKPAGWFKHEDPDCRAAHDGRLKDVELLAAKADLGKVDKKDLAPKLDELRRAGYLEESEIATAIRAGLSAAIGRALGDNVLTEEEEDNIAQFAEASGVSFSDEDRLRLVKAGTIRELLEGKLPNRMKISGAGVARFNLRPGEEPVWLFGDVGLLGERHHRSYAGVSSGMSFRIASGVYYRVGAFRGEPIDTANIEKIDSGALLVTPTRLIFSGQLRSSVIDLRKVATFQPFDDGIGIAKESVNSKLVFYQTGDGWFTYNLLKNLADMAEVHQ